MRNRQMVDKWEWDTFMAINAERESHHVPPLGWCCLLEAFIRKNVNGKVFEDIHPSHTKSVWLTCLHWTPPQNIARKLIGSWLYNGREILNARYKSGAVVILNDKQKTRVCFIYSGDNPISWDELCNRQRSIDDMRAFLKKEKWEREIHDDPLHHWH